MMTLLMRNALGNISVDRPTKLKSVQQNRFGVTLADGVFHGQRCAMENDSVHMAKTKWDVMHCDQDGKNSQENRSAYCVCVFTNIFSPNA